METTATITPNILSLPQELRFLSLARGPIHRIDQVCRTLRAETDELWNERWNQYKNIPALAKFIKLYQHLPGKFQQVKAVYEAVIRVIKQENQDSEPIFKASKEKFHLDALNPYRLQELLLDNEDQKIIYFFSAIKKQINAIENEDKTPTPPHLTQNQYNSEREFADAIKEWFKDGALCKSCLDQISYIELNSIPSEIQYLSNLEILFIDAIPNPSYMTSLPTELSKLKRLENIMLGGDFSFTFREVPLELLELPYKEGWAFDQVGVDPQNRYYTFGSYATWKAKYLSNMVQQLDPIFWRNEIEPIQNRNNDEYRNSIDSIKTMEQWIEQNKAKLSEITELEINESWAYFPSNIREFDQLKILKIKYANYFYPEVAELRNLESLTFIPRYLTTPTLDEYPLPNLSDLKNLKSLSISLKTIPKELLALTNLETLHLSSNEFTLPCDEVLDSSNKGIQNCLSNQPLFNDYVNFYKDLLGKIDGEQPVIDSLTNLYREQPGQLFLHLRNRINSYRDLLAPIFENCFSIQLPAFVSEELKRFQNGTYDNCLYPTLKTDPSVHQKGNSIRLQYRHAIVLRDWIQDTTISRIKMTVALLFSGFVVGTSWGALWSPLALYNYSFTAKIVISSFIAITLANLFIKIIKRPNFLLNYSKHHIRLPF